MKTLPYLPPPAWSWPTDNFAFANPEQWHPRKWMEQITRQLPALPTVAQRLFGGQAMPSPEQSGSLTPIGTNRQPISAVRECVLIRQRGRQVLTALRNTDKRLQLLSWRVTADGSVVCTGESGIQPETITQLDIAQASKFVIACRTASQRLKLISWDVSNTGAVYRAGESQEQRATIRKVKLVALAPTLLLSAAITSAHQLQLTSWQLASTADLTPLQQTNQAERLHELVIVQLPSAATNQVMTVARTSGGALQLQVWQVTTNGEITLLGRRTIQAASGTQVQAVVNEQGMVITSFRTPSGHLRLNVWQVSADGRQIEQVADTGASEERIRRQTLMVLPSGVVTAVTLPQGQLQLLAWEFNSDGRIIRRHAGEKTITRGHDFAFCPTLLDGNAPILTSLRNAQGGLELMTWRG